MKTVIRSKEWVSEPDPGRAAAPASRRMVCDMCGEASPKSALLEAAQTWQLQHAAADPTHHSCTEVTTRPWRARMNGPA